MHRKLTGLDTGWLADFGTQTTFDIKHPSCKDCFRFSSFPGGGGKGEELSKQTPVSVSVLGRVCQQTTIFRLRTGHCGLSAHLKRIGISDTSLCECRQAD